MDQCVGQVGAIIPACRQAGIARMIGDARTYRGNYEICGVHHAYRDDPIRAFFGIGHEQHAGGNFRNVFGGKDRL